jgi:hypothetical protein
MEKEIFFLFNPDAPEVMPAKKEKYRSALPQPAQRNRPEKKQNSFKLSATICKVLSAEWWN